MTDETRAIYARVPAPLHDYVTSQSAESGLSMAKVVEAILTRARDSGWSVRTAAGYEVTTEAGT